MTREQIAAAEREAIRCGWTDSQGDVAKSLGCAVSMWALLAEFLALCLVTTHRAALVMPLAVGALVAVVMAWRANRRAIAYHRAVGIPAHPRGSLVLAFLLAPLSGVPALIVKTGITSRSRTIA